MPVASEKSSSVSSSYSAPSSSYEAAAAPSYQAPVSQGNLYYYYYPVAAYPIHEKTSPSSSYSSVSSGGSDISPLLFILVPLILLLIAVPFIALVSNNNNGRSFNGGRASDLDDKFGSFDELQTAIDKQLERYMSALGADDCIERIVCELGVKASRIPSKELFFRYVIFCRPRRKNAVRRP